MTESPSFVFGRIQPAITRCRESHLPGFRQIDPVMSAFENRRLPLPVSGLLPVWNGLSNQIPSTGSEKCLNLSVGI